MPLVTIVMSIEGYQRTFFFFIDHSSANFKSVLNGGGVFLACRDPGGRGGGGERGRPDELFPQFFFFKVEISPQTTIPLLKPISDYSSLASRDDCGLAFFDELPVSSLS